MTKAPILLKLVEVPEKNQLQYGKEQAINRTIHSPGNEKLKFQL